MSMREQSDHYRAWQHGPDRARDVDAPADCDCADTIRELLLEVVGTVSVFLAAILLARALT